MNEPAVRGPRGSLRPRRRWVILAGAAIAIALLAGVRLSRGDRIQYLTAKIQRGDIQDAVDATGTITAVITVQVGSQVSGTIAKLNADFNSIVHQGDVIALIDPSLFQGELNLATADLESARANVAVVTANLAKARASLLQVRTDYDRTAALVKQQLQTRQAMDLAQASYDAARASVQGAEAAVSQAEAQVKQKEAAVAIARTNLEYTTIRSPIDGIVVARNVDVGQTVAASLQAPTIFSIAQDLTKMRLFAKTDESDVGRIRVGQPVTFKVDAFPKESFHGVVGQIRMDATVVQNVVTYDTVIDFENPDRKLFPGMTAYVTIPVATARDVVKVPNTALRFEPPLSPAETRALYEKAGIDEQTVGPKRESAVIWKLRGPNAIEPVEITTGITDHAFTQLAGIVKGGIKVGDEVATASLAAKPTPLGGQGVRR